MRICVYDFCPPSDTLINYHCSYIFSLGSFLVNADPYCVNVHFVELWFTACDVHRWLLNDVVQCCLRCRTRSPASGRRSSWNWCWSSVRTRSKAYQATGTMKTSVGNRRHAGRQSRSAELAAVLTAGRLLFGVFLQSPVVFKISWTILLSLCWCDVVSAFVMITRTVTFCFCTFQVLCWLEKQVKCNRLK